MKNYKLIAALLTPLLAACPGDGVDQTIKDNGSSYTPRTAEQEKEWQQREKRLAEFQRRWAEKEEKAKIDRCNAATIEAKIRNSKNKSETIHCYDTSLVENYYVEEDCKEASDKNGRHCFKGHNECEDSQIQYNIDRPRSGCHSNKYYCDSCTEARTCTEHDGMYVFRDFYSFKDTTTLSNDRYSCKVLRLTYLSNSGVECPEAVSECRFAGMSDNIK